jgi:hypothetical protein
MSEQLTSKAVQEFLDETLGSYTEIFSVRYTKRTDGSERKHRCFRKVQKHLRGGTLGYDADEKNLIKVWIPEPDRRENEPANGYRSVPAEGIIEIHAAEKVFHNVDGQLVEVSE